MKRLLFLFCLVSVFNFSYADSKTDSAFNRLDTNIKVVRTQLSAVQKSITDSSNSLKKIIDSVAKKTCNCTPLTPEESIKNWDKIGSWAGFLIFLPFFIFILCGILLCFVNIWDFDLKKALSENDIDKITIPNKQYDINKLSAFISNAGNNNPSLIANLITLFPPTIEVSNIQSITDKPLDTIKGMIDDAILAKNALEKAKDELEKAKEDFEKANNFYSAAKKVVDNGVNLKPEEKQSADKNAIDAKADADKKATIVSGLESNKDNLKLISDKANELVNNAKKIAFNNNDEFAKALFMPSKDSNYRPSSSRLIAFITSIFTLAILLAMSCFYIYHYMYTGCPPDMSTLTTMMITLGIGVTPYAFNKIAGAVKNSKPDSL